MSENCKQVVSVLCEINKFLTDFALGKYATTTCREKVIDPENVARRKESFLILIIPDIFKPVPP